LIVSTCLWAFSARRMKPLVLWIVLYVAYSSVRYATIRFEYERCLIRPPSSSRCVSTPQCWNLVGRVMTSPSYDTSTVFSCLTKQKTYNSTAHLRFEEIPLSLQFTFIHLLFNSGLVLGLGISGIRSLVYFCESSRIDTAYKGLSTDHCCSSSPANSFC
jgi:hypothetical protein